MTAAPPRSHSAIKGNVLVVEDDSTVARGVCRTLEQAGYRCLHAATGSDALDFARAQGFDLVVLDLGLPDADGAELFKQLRGLQADTGVLVHTAVEDLARLESLVCSGVDGYVHKPFDPITLHGEVAAIIARRKQKKSESVALAHRLAKNLMSAWNLRHVETGEHVQRIGLFSAMLARKLGLSSDDAAALGHVATLHDIGKICIPDSILTKPGKLSAEEFEVMKTHTTRGAELLSGLAHPFFERAAVIALHHHERWNGSGYPSRLVGEACPLDARIVAVVDVYDALSQVRCYKQAWDEARILDYFTAERGRLFDPVVTDAFLAALPELKTIGQIIPEPASSAAADHEAGSGVFRATLAAQQPTHTRVE
jgi:putative two-component system response regulator